MRADGVSAVTAVPFGELVARRFETPGVNARAAVLRRKFPLCGSGKLRADPGAERPRLIPVDAVDRMRATRRKIAAVPDIGGRADPCIDALLVGIDRDLGAADGEGFDRQFAAGFFIRVASPVVRVTTEVERASAE